MREHKAIEHGDRIEVCYREEPHLHWTGILSYPIEVRATALAHAHALNCGIDPNVLAAKLNEVANVTAAQWLRQRRRRLIQPDLFEPEDPPEGAYEAMLSCLPADAFDPDLPF